MQDYVGLFFPDWTMEWTKGPDNPIFTKTKSKLDHVFDTKHFLLDIFHLSTSFHHFSILTSIFPTFDRPLSFRLNQMTDLIVFLIQSLGQFWKRMLLPFDQVIWEVYRIMI